MDYRIVADREFMLRLALSALPYITINKLVYRYRQHADAMTFDINDQKLQRIVNEHILMTGIYLEQNILPVEARNLICRLRTRETIEMAVRSLKKFNLFRFVDYFQQGIKYDPFWLQKFTRRVVYKELT
jgi:hypothetical protein